MMKTVPSPFPQPPQGQPLLVVDLLSYFAARAPVEIPHWFVHTPPPINYPPMPDANQLDAVHQKTARDWILDGCFELPDEIKWFGEKVIERRKAKAEWELLDRANRFYQWRWEYALAMVKTHPSNRPVPPAEDYRRQEL